MMRVESYMRHEKIEMRGRKTIKGERIVLDLYIKSMLNQEDSYVKRVIVFSLLYSIDSTNSNFCQNFQQSRNVTYYILLVDKIGPYHQPRANGVDLIHRRSSGWFRSFGIIVHVDSTPIHQSKFKTRSCHKVNVFERRSAITSGL